MDIHVSNPDLNRKRFPMNIKSFQHDPMPSVSPGRRVAVYYFLQAMSVGAVNAFAGIWLAFKGLGPEQIGVIFAVPVGVIMLIGLPIGRLSDRAADWRQGIVIGALASAITPLGLFFVHGVWGLGLVWALAVTTQMMILPVTDAAALRLSRRQGGDFGMLYAWKTIGYLLVVFGSGFLVTRFGAKAFLPLFVGLSILRGFASLGLPEFRATREREALAPRTSTRHFLRSVGPGFILPLAGWSMVHCTHFVLNGFLGLIWYEQGLSASTIGVLIGVSGLAETVLFFGFKHVAFRWSAERLILVSCLAGVIRWTLFSFSPGVEVLVVLQLLHAVTYALGFLACTNFIANWADEEVAAEAQSFFSILEAGLAILALVVFGWLSGTFGAKAFLASAVFAATGWLLVWMSRYFQTWKVAGAG